MTTPFWMRPGLLEAVTHTRRLANAMQRAAKAVRLLDIGASLVSSDIHRPYGHFDPRAVCILPFISTSSAAHRTLTPEASTDSSGLVRSEESGECQRVQHRTRACGTPRADAESQRRKSASADQPLAAGTNDARSADTSIYPPTFGYGTCYGETGGNSPTPFVHIKDHRSCGRRAPHTNPGGRGTFVFSNYLHPAFHQSMAKRSVAPPLHEHRRCHATAERAHQ